MSKHQNFILTPITNILEEAVAATAGIGIGMEVYPLSNYILQSTFLSMTGFQEQKLKCICWELATNDFEFRYQWLEEGNSKQGAYSQYKSKEYVYEKLIATILKYDKDFKIEEIDKQKILDNCIQTIINIFSNSNLIHGVMSKYNYFESAMWTNAEQILHSHKKLFKPREQEPKKSDKLKKIEEKKEKGENIKDNEEDQIKQFNERMTKYKVSSNYNLQDKYSDMYDNRNRLAHNTLSYQNNLPTFEVLLKETDESRNYFIWFGILVLIDSIMMELFKIYLDKLENSVDYLYY